MKKKNWYNPKAYTHFSPKLGHRNAGLVQGYVINENAIAKHRFHPLIHRPIVTRRFKVVGKDKHGISIKGHKMRDGTNKTTAKFREIFYCNHLDAHIYSYYTSRVLEPLYDKEISKYPRLNSAIIAYRRIPLGDKSRCKCNIDFADEVFELIKIQKGEIAVLAFDISKFFDSLNHKKLKQAWAKLLDKKSLPNDHFTLYKNLTRFSYVEYYDILKEFDIKHPNLVLQKGLDAFTKNGEEFRRRIKEKGYLKLNPFRVSKDGKKVMAGIPQGTPISAFLANLYMLDFDKAIWDLVVKMGGIYRRYSDDILIICPSEKQEEIESAVYSLITKSDLVIQPEKTQKTFFYNGKLCTGSKPISYLGFIFDGKHKYLKSTSISKFYQKMKRTIRYRAYRACLAKKTRLRHPLIDITIHRKQLYNRFSFLGASNDSRKKRNFISYVNFASKIMNEPKIKNQLSKAWSILNADILAFENRYKLNTK